MSHEPYTKLPSRRCRLSLLIAFGCASCVGVAGAATDNANDDSLILMRVFWVTVVLTLALPGYLATHAFMPGESTVLLAVNGDNRGRIKVRFDEKGHYAPIAPFRIRLNWYRHLGMRIVRPASTCARPGLKLTYRLNRARVKFICSSHRKRVVHQALSRETGNMAVWRACSTMMLCI